MLPNADHATLLETRAISPNPNNPRLYFNEESLDQLKTSIQEVGILVPLIVYENPDSFGEYILLDGERRWKCALELGIVKIPVGIINPPTDRDNILRMFNIHAVREEWPLVSIALSLRKIMLQTLEDRETRLAEMTGLTRGTVRRAKRLLELPEHEMDLIASEAHLDRIKQIHREDLYLEIMAATSVILNQFPELKEEYGRNRIIRQLVSKKEVGTDVGVTDFRSIPKLIRSIPLVSEEKIYDGIKRIIDDTSLNPQEVFIELAEVPTRKEAFASRSRQLLSALEDMESMSSLDAPLIDTLRKVQSNIARLLDAL